MWRGGVSRKSRKEGRKHKKFLFAGKEREKWQNSTVMEAS